MHLQQSFSGIVVILVVTSIGLTSGIECINCSWDASTPGSANSSILCLSDAHKEPNMTCPARDKLTPICETKIEFNVVGKLTTMKKLTRRCAYDHPDCDKPCIPTENPVCYQCCVRNNICNTLPLTLKPMQPTSSATSNHVIMVTWVKYFPFALITMMSIRLVNLLA